MRSSTLVLLAAAFSGLFVPAQAPADLITRTALMSEAVGFWAFSGGTGTTAADSSTTTPAIPLSVGGSGSPSWQSSGGPMGGMFGSFLQFPANSFLTTGSDQNALDFTASDPFSIAAWVKLDPGSSNVWVASKMESSGDFRGWGLQVRGTATSPNNAVELWLRHTNSPANYLAVRAIADVALETDWTHLAATYDGSGVLAGVTIYVNGKPMAIAPMSQTLTQEDTTNTVPFSIAGRNTSGSLRGAIDEVGVWSRVLTASEVASLVPEPSAVMLLAFSMLGLFWRRRLS
ncbi:MAG: LamG-like jellyroll fold domain-containing protein [Patescibacteria group bacterium]|nr:LamG-like jellyroll fold domain-containing protein [Patescibacteria group bacterium]